jgi:toxin ParE1/3/4
MNRFEVRFSALAEDDLFELYHFIAGEAGRHVAGGYIERIEAACLKLEMFPERGTRRDDIRPGLRTVGFERRVTIVFQVGSSEVLIVRILYGGQEFDHGLRMDDL